MKVLGVSALYHDSAAAIISDGEIVAAVQEERFTRRKADAGIPQNAIKFCLDAVQTKAEDLDAIVYYDNPFMTLNRYLWALEESKDDIDDLLASSLENIVLP